MNDESNIPLTKNQKDILREFYSAPYTPVILTKSERHEIWHQFKTERVIPDLNLDSICPALLAEIEKALDSGNLVQSAVFSECVYAQTLANMLDLVDFFIFASEPEAIPQPIVNLILSYHLTPRYVYKSKDGNRLLIQAGGSAGIDSALISVHDKNVFTIEFKEPGSKTSEPDLPAYGEDGNLKLDETFLVRNPQFEVMLREQLEKGLNFWTVMGTNVNDFSLQGIQVAVSENYSSKKYADVICVEDNQGYLTMMPANQVGSWATTEGEIRPAGRNAYDVWTPDALAKFIVDSGGKIDCGKVSIPVDRMNTATRRGGDNSIARYKVNSLFFVRAKHVTTVGGLHYFDLVNVQQLKPTIAAKMFFTGLEVASVHEHYRPEF